ncbi:YbjN domain-containing protein [Clostridium sp. ATCC 25772]|uniref:YbjN domain-containing protein n=1 Tax=Clostridium sp. ATCC 25772 TaxID=1676991 RepID=UPI000782A824|nr:YbjN domain-containing protein [Clostridium sp. ATCC 25772]
MRNNSTNFEGFLETRKIPMNKGMNIDNVTIFSFPEKLTINGVERPVLGGGIEKRAVISLTDDDTLADIYIFHITSIPQEDNKIELYKLFNELNSTYKYISFYENDNVVNAKSSIPFNNNFNAEIVFETLTVMFHAIEEEYEKIRSSINLKSKIVNLKQ